MRELNGMVSAIQKSQRGVSELKLAIELLKKYIFYNQAFIPYAGCNPESYLGASMDCLHPVGFRV